MKRRFLSLAIGLILAAIIGAPAVDAQQTKAIPRVAYVYIFKEGPSAPFVEAFRQRLRELGWADRQNITIEVHDADGNPDKLAAIMRELVDSKVDVIVAACTPEAKVAAKFTTTIPIVMAATGDPVAAGLVASLAKPGGNITGVSAMLLDLSAKRLAILKEAFPKVSHATVLWNPGRPDNLPEVKAMQTAAQALGVRLDSPAGAYARRDDRCSRVAADDRDRGDSQCRRYVAEQPGSDAGGICRKAATPCTI